MADFFAERINVGIETLPQFQVYIYMTNCGVTEDGRHKATQNCATVDELNYAVDRTIAELNKAREIAKGILEENR